METNLSNPVNLKELAASVVAGYVSGNQMPWRELPIVISEAYDALSSLGQPRPEPAPPKPTPLIPPRKTITPDYIISLEDGQHYKSLKRHLSGRGMTPEQYRQKWDLPYDYPMVAPNYSKQRSELAKRLGLGTSTISGKAKRGKPRGSRK